MTRRYGRQGKKYNRSGLPDPRGTWATGVPASAGFVPEQPVQVVAPGPASTGMKLSRQGAQKTRLKHGLLKQGR